MLDHFFDRRVVFGGVGTIDGPVLKVLLLHADASLVSIALHLTEYDRRGVVVVERGTTLATLNEIPWVLRILIREPLQVDIIDLLELDEGVCVS